MCDVLPDGDLHFDDHPVCIFDINSMLCHSLDLGITGSPQEILLGANMILEEKKRITKTLIKRQKYFAWSYEDIPRVDREIAKHKIPTHLEVKLIKQKLYRLCPKWA